MCVCLCVCVYVRVHGGPGQLGVDACPGVECGEGHRRGQAVLVAELGGRHAVLLGHLSLVRLTADQHTGNTTVHVVLLQAGREGERGRGRERESL